MTAAGTLPTTDGVRDRSKVPFDGAPTWVRCHVGGGQYRRIRLRQDTGLDLVAAVLADNSVREVWVLPADEWSPGDRIETGPLPDGVVIVHNHRPGYADTAARVGACGSSISLNTSR